MGRDGEAAVLLRAARPTILALYGPDQEAARLPDTLLAEIESRRGKPAAGSK